VMIRSATKIRRVIMSSRFVGRRDLMEVNVEEMLDVSVVTGK